MKNLNKQFMIITAVGMVIGVAEALIYYNMGKSKETGKFTYSVPPPKQLGQTVLTVLASSLITAGITAGIEMMFFKEGSVNAMTPAMA